MSQIPEDLLYSEEHEYLKSTDQDGEYVVGITDYAQNELGDVVFVELPAAGSTVKQSEVFGTVEAVKAVSDLFSPVGGAVLEVNAALERDPALVNNDPYGAGWMVRVRINDSVELDALLGPDEYRKLIGE
ncbi:MAG: glycine cleavage system protein GcvH [Longimicrobiales bacterium]